MIYGGHFPKSAIDAGLRSLVSELNATHPGYRWEVVPRDEDRPFLDRKPAPADQNMLERATDEAA